MAAGSDPSALDDQKTPMAAFAVLRHGSNSTRSLSLLLEYGASWNAVVRFDGMGQSPVKKTKNQNGRATRGKQAKKNLTLLEFARESGSSGALSLLEAASLNKKQRESLVVVG